MCISYEIGKIFDIGIDNILECCLDRQGYQAN